MILLRLWRWLMGQPDELLVPHFRRRARERMAAVFSRAKLLRPTA